MKYRTMNYINLRDIEGLSSSEADQLIGGWEANNGSYFHVDLTYKEDPTDYLLENYLEFCKAGSRLWDVLKDAFPQLDEIYVEVDW